VTFLGLARTGVISVVLDRLVHRRLVVHRHDGLQGSLKLWSSTVALKQLPMARGL
jgi:hypothetical protein